jgi:hypothetical protein
VPLVLSCFDERPYGIPVARVADKFKVIGNFCSLECASAHNFDIPERDGQRETYSLTSSMMMGDGCEKTPAPPRCVLKLFGGDMNIDKFRNEQQDQTLVSLLDDSENHRRRDRYACNSERRQIRPIDDDKLKRFKIVLK